MKAFFVKLVCFSVFYLVISCSVSQDYYSDDNYESEVDNFVREPGKCYAKCLILDKLENELELIPLYIGGDYNDDYVEFQEVTIKPPTTKWVKRKADRNCLSADPNDCMVWCLVEVPGESIELYVVTDTSLTKDYELKSLNTEVLIKNGAGNEWREILCQNQITVELYEDLIQQLSERNYEFNLNENELIGPEEIMETLEKFQRDTNLPVGNLNIETMDALEIIY